MKIVMLLIFVKTKKIKSAPNFKQSFPKMLFK